MKKTAILQLSLLGLALLPGFASAQFTVAMTTPANADVAVAVAVNRSVIVQFNGLVDGMTVNANTFIVRGEQYGAYAGTLTPAGNQTIFTPAINYLPGELITAHLTGGILNMGGAALTPFSFQFYTGADGCAAFTIIDSGQLLGMEDTHGA